MTSTQFYFGLGVPFFTVVLMYIVATISNRAAINDLKDSMALLGKRIDDLGGRINDLGLRVNDVRTDLGVRLDRIERKLEVLDTEIRVSHDHRLAVLEARVLEKAS